MKVAVVLFLVAVTALCINARSIAEEEEIEGVRGRNANLDEGNPEGLSRQKRSSRRRRPISSSSSSSSSSEELHKGHKGKKGRGVDVHAPPPGARPAGRRSGSRGGRQFFAPAVASPYYPATGGVVYPAGAPVVYG